MGTQTNPWINFLAGGVGGACCIVIGHPLDTIKVRLQWQRSSKKEQPRYRGVIDCFRKTIATDPRGFFSLYRGMGAPLIGVTPLFALFFFGCSMGRKLQETYPGEVLSLMQTFNAGACAGVLTTLILVPAERIKCLLQVEEGKGETRYSGPVDAARQVYKEGGIRSIYRGTFATLLRGVPANGTYLASYEFVLRQMAGDMRSELNVASTLLAGGIAGICNWIVAIVPDTLKTRLQTAPEGKYPDGIRGVFRELVREEGFFSLYRGFTAVMLRAFPANAACFLGYEATMALLNGIQG